MASRSEACAAVAVVALVLAAVAPGSARATPEPELAAQGSITLSMTATGFSRFDHGYLILGAGAGYFLVDGLELGLGGAYWLGGEPVVASAGPRARYVFWQAPIDFKPYAGAALSHWFVGDSLDDASTVVARAGLTGRVSHHARFLFEAGFAVERLVTTCEECWELYPEFAMTASF